MRKITTYRIVNYTLIVLYLVLLVSNHYTNFLNISFYSLWFPLFALLISISLFSKSILFKSDSSLWLAVALFLVSAYLFTMYGTAENVNDYLAIIFSIIMLSSFIVGVVFKEIYQIKVSIMVGIISVPFYLLSFKIIKMGLFFGLLFATILVGYFIVGLLPDRWYDKRKK